MQKAKKSTEKMTAVPSCSVGVAVGLITTILLVSVGALCILNEYIKFHDLSTIAVVIHFLSVTLACITAGSVSFEKQIMCCATTGSICCLTYTGVAMLFFDGITGTVLLSLLSTVLGIGVSLFVVTRSKKVSVRKKIKKRSR